MSWREARSSPLIPPGSLSQSRALLRAQLLARLKRRGKCKCEDKFHTFSHVSGQKKELAGPASGAGSTVGHLGAGRAAENNPAGQNGESNTFKHFQTLCRSRLIPISCSQTIY